MDLGWISPLLSLIKISVTIVHFSVIWILAQYYDAHVQRLTLRQRKDNSQHDIDTHLNHLLTLLPVAAFSICTIVFEAKNVSRQRGHGVDVPEFLTVGNQFLEKPFTWR